MSTFCKILTVVKSSATVNGASKRFVQTSSVCNAKVAVILSGCGVYDGSEIHEASACLVHLSRQKAEVAMFAPNVDQMHVIDHLKGAPASGDNRNVLVESARIARGNIQSLDSLKVDQFDAVVFPGGFGAAKNLSTFAVDGAKMKVNKDVENTIKSFHSAKKPIGLCCISPVLAASVIKGCEVTIGSDAGTAGAIQEMGAKHVNKPVGEAQVDTRNKVVTTPAFMCEAPLHEIFDGIGAMISGTLKLAGK
jgi:enhancing lycopene biosynthesis protein 2